MNEMNLKQEAEQLLSEIDTTHRYSMSRIYSLSNRISGRNETPQSCASCLIRKVRELRNWLETQKTAEALPQAESEVKVKKNGKPKSKN